MLPDRYRQLLTAFVDGELTARQRRHVARLLHRSPEARSLLHRLQEDAQQLRDLPRPALAFDLTGEVMRTIAERRLSPGSRRLQPRSVASTWAAPLATWAAAAAVLLILGVTSYLYFAASVPQPDNPDLAQTDTETSPSVVAPDSPRPSSVAKGETPKASPPSHPQARPDHPKTNPPVEVVKRPEKPLIPAPEQHPAPPKEDAALTDRMEMFRLTAIDASLPVVMKVHELDQEATRRKLIVELNKDANYRLELPCKNGTKAFERVQAGAKALNLGLLIEKRAQDRLKVPGRKTNYVVYIENLPPEELARFLQHIAAEDKKSAARKPAEAQLDGLVLTRMTKEHHKELSTLLGVDPTVLEPAARGPLGTDPRKPLSEQTAKQVSASLAGQGSLPRPTPGKPVAKPPENFALVLAYNPVRPSPGSAEIKRFLDNRKPARPGTLRVLLVLRS